MNGWYVVYLLVVGINAATLSSITEGGIKTPQFWISAVCVILAYLAGRNR